MAVDDDNHKALPREILFLTSSRPIYVSDQWYLNNSVSLKELTIGWQLPRGNLMGFIKYKYASFKNIKFPRGNYQTDSFEKYTRVYCNH